MIKLYNTLTRKKDDLIPLKEGLISMYCCGPTVYNYAHIGNLRTYIFEDILKRTLEHIYQVRHVMNITDVGHLVSDSDEGQDKMELGAAREGKSAWDIAKFYEESFFKDFDSLNCKRPTITARATQHIKEMINLVKTLEEKGYTYKTSDGIYFDTSKFKEYHNLVGKSHIEGLKSGARVEFNSEKRNASDFALWKFSPKTEKRQMEWQSPWGVGFPGWHIECSAMAMKYLGETLDIHCGGIDHIAVHHTNEIAQSQAATGKQYVRNWIHGEFLVLPAGKMSKSSGGFLTISTLKEKGYNPLDYRYLCLGAHYRTQLEFSWEALDFARASLKSLKQKIADLKNQQTGSLDDNTLKTAKETFFEAISDDLNTSKALAFVWEFLKTQNTPLTKLELVKFADTFLGLDLLKEEEAELPKEALALIEERQIARKNKDFKKSDEIRAKLEQMGILIKDTPQGPKWSLK